MSIRAIFMAALLALAVADRAAAQLPAPDLQFDGVEERQTKGREVVIYKLSVANRASFASELFSPAPDLPACGGNANASRTWINVHDGDGSSVRLYGFCALKSADELAKLWFALPKERKAPGSVYIAVTDRRANVTITSNSVRLPPAGSTATPGAADLWKECQSQQLEQAARACTRIIESGREHGMGLARAYSLRAINQDMQGQPDRAVADYDRAIEIMKDAGIAGWELAFTYFVRGKAYRSKGDLERAIADQTESIRVAPDWDKAYSERGAIYFQKGDLARALDDIGKVISFRPDSPRVASSYAIRAMLHQRLGDPAKGLVDADRAVELGPRLAMALYIRARIYEALGRTEEAAEGMRAALAIDAGVKEQIEAMERAAK
jgi:tetratricopeptide (TPR) repeat protein